MATDKMNSSAVYELFEELKQKIMELERKTPWKFRQIRFLMLRK